MAFVLTSVYILLLPVPASHCGWKPVANKSPKSKSAHPSGSTSTMCSTSLYEDEAGDWNVKMKDTEVKGH